MLENANGGRCICSNKNNELNNLLAQIEELDQKSYEIATVGVQSIESGVDVETLTEMPEQETGIDLSLWNISTPEEDDDDPAPVGFMAEIADKTGDALYAAANDICSSQIPECSNQIDMMSLMYRQQIRSDCTAYENALKQQQLSSQEKLNAAQSALRDASYTALQSANKYDLGQCTIEFKNCMMTTGGCGDDFSGCATVSAFDDTNTRKSTTREITAYSIKGATTIINIAASTYDALFSKKPLCDGITRQCTAVADQVWDTFLREAAPQIKNAELIAEDNARQDCVGNISSCFQQACKDTMDPNDPDGSYDMCLTRPETMLNLCQVPLNACGISTTSAAEAEKSSIWDFVVARLASMRVNSCTNQVKECLQSDDMCGADYTQCIGLETDTIMRMCPYQSLVGCQQVYGEENIQGDDVYDELANMVQGIMVNIDNNLLTECQKVADESMIRVCGDSEDCSNLTTDDNIGARSLEYKICQYEFVPDSMDLTYGNCRNDVSQITDAELGRVEGSTTGELGPVTPLAGIIDGVIYWESVEIDSEGHLSSVDEYFEKIGETNISDAQKEKVRTELGNLQKSIDMAIQAIENDPSVQFCMTGREVQGISEKLSTIRDDGTSARFPNLTKQMRIIIANSALKIAKENYYKKYDELTERMLQDYVTMSERMAEIQQENALDARRYQARYACVTLADMSSLPKTPTPKSLAGTMITMVMVVAATVVVTVFTAGAGGIAIGAGIAAIDKAIASGTTAGLIGIGQAAAATSLSTSTIIAAAAGAGGAGYLGGMIGSLTVGDNSSVDINELPMSGRHETNQWNFKEVVTSDFNWETLVCHKCTRTTNCEQTRTPLFGNMYCKKWGEPTEVCKDIQF